MVRTRSLTPTGDDSLVHGAIAECAATPVRKSSAYKNQAPLNLMKSWYRRRRRWSTDLFPRETRYTTRPIANLSSLYAFQLTIAVHSCLHPFQLSIAARLNDSEPLRLIDLLTPRTLLPRIAVRLNDSEPSRLMDLLTPRTLQLLRMGVYLLVVCSVSSFSSRKASLDYNSILLL
jgi:hypothetical protein